MTRQQLVHQIFEKQSYLCVGLDADIQKIPRHLLSHPDPVFEFNRQIINATKQLCVAYKINTAFYEAMGVRGWETLERTVSHIPEEHFKIADAKRGDIGNTSSQYARAFFETLNFDAITIAPYMGEDSVKPFLEYDGKWAIVLGLTSNPGAKDFELQKFVTRTHLLDEGIHIEKQNERYLYEMVLEKVSKWGTPNNLMFVVGATQASEFEKIRQLTPQHFYLVPGVGAQGGSLKDVTEKTMIKSDGGLLVNVSRDIIYASDRENFAEAAANIAKIYQEEMTSFLKDCGAPARTD